MRSDHLLVFQYATINLKYIGEVVYVRLEQLGISQVTEARGSSFNQPLNIYEI